MTKQEGLLFKSSLICGLGFRCGIVRNRDSFAGSILIYWHQGSSVMDGFWPLLKMSLGTKSLSRQRWRLSHRQPRRRLRRRRQPWEWPLLSCISSDRDLSPPEKSCIDWLKKCDLGLGLKNSRGSMGTKSSSSQKYHGDEDSGFTGKPWFTL